MYQPTAKTLLHQPPLMASHPHPTPKSRVSRETIGKAVDAILKWTRSKSNQKKTQLLIYLVLTLKKIPHRGRHSSFRIPLPNPVYHPISLVVDDRPNSPLSPSAARHLVQSLSLPVTDIIPFSDLPSDYNPPFGLLFADRRIVLLLRKNSFKKNKEKEEMPVVPLDLSRLSWTEELWKYCGSTVLNFRGGTCSGIKVGRASQSRDEIVENVMAAVEGAVGNVPKKWANVRSFHVKAAESLALPIYQAVPELVQEEDVEEKGSKGLAAGKRSELEKNNVGDEVRARKRKSKNEKLEDAREIKRSKVRHEIY